MGENIQTVFDFCQAANAALSEAKTWVGFGFVSLLSSLALWIMVFRRIWRKNNIPSVLRTVFPALITFIAAFSSFESAINIVAVTKCRNAFFSSARENQLTKTVEGEVQVVFQQEFGSHSKGDVVVVDGVEFEVNPNWRTDRLTYRRSIALGGSLTQGSWVRIEYYDNSILRIGIIGQVSQDE
jgi:hypothetical protein